MLTKSGAKLLDFGLAKLQPTGGRRHEHGRHREVRTADREHGMEAASPNSQPCSITT